MTPEQRLRFLTEITKRLTDDGRLIEAGFVGLQMVAIPSDASETQVREMRMAFMAGAQHLFASLLNVLDPGEEPTDADMRRIDLIATELDAFRQEMELRVSKPEGRG
jgi:hypothetical protein